MKMPSTEALDVAIAWLECNEGKGHEGEACKAVAAWLEYMNHEAFIRHEARARGVTVAQFRRAEAGHKR